SPGRKNHSTSAPVPMPERADHLPPFVRPSTRSLPRSSSTENLRNAARSNHDAPFLQEVSKLVEPLKLHSIQSEGQRALDIQFAIVDENGGRTIEGGYPQGVEVHPLIGLDLPEVA